MSWATRRTMYCKPEVDGRSYQVHHFRRLLRLFRCVTSTGPHFTTVDFAFLANQRMPGPSRQASWKWLSVTPTQGEPQGPWVLVESKRPDPLTIQSTS